MTKAQLRGKEKRQRIYDLRREGHSWPEVGAAMGLLPETCEEYFRKSVRRGEFEAFPSPDAHRSRVMERREPEAAAAVIAGMAAAVVMGDDPKFKRLKEECREVGMKPSLVTSLIKRLQVGNYSPVTAEVKRLVGKDLIEALESKTTLVLNYMDEYSVSTASLKDLSIAASVLIEKQQLLKNQPTQILDVTTRMKVVGLLPAMIREAERRGLSIDSTARRVDEPR